MAAWRRSPRPCGLPPAPCCRARRAASPAAATPRGCSASGNLIPFDMGGTSTDICLIVEGEPRSGQRPRHRRPSRGAAQPRHRQPRRRRRLDRARRRRRHPARRPGERRRGAGPRLLRPGRHRGHRDRRQSGPRLSRSRQLPRRRARLDCGGRRGGGRSAGGEPEVDRMAAAEGVHRVVNTNMAEGIRLVSVRRGVDPRRFALLSFGGAAGAARHRRRAPARPDAGRRAARRGRAVGVGHAGHRPPLRGGADAYRRRRAPRRRRHQRPVRRDGGRGAARGCARRSTGRCACSARSTCATASRSSRSACRSTASTGTSTTRCRRSSSASTGATRSSTPTRCATRRPCWSTRAWP